MIKPIRIYFHVAGRVFYADLIARNFGDARAQIKNAVMKQYGLSADKTTIDPTPEMMEQARPWKGAAAC